MIFSVTISLDFPSFTHFFVVLILTMQNMEEVCFVIRFDCGLVYRNSAFSATILWYDDLDTVRFPSGSAIYLFHSLHRPYGFLRRYYCYGLRLLIISECISIIWMIANRIALANGLSPITRYPH